VNGSRTFNSLYESSGYSSSTSAQKAMREFFHHYAFFSTYLLIPSYVPPGVRIPQVEKHCSKINDAGVVWSRDQNARKFPKKNCFFPRALENVEKLENIKIIHFRKKPNFLENKKKNRIFGKL